MKWSFKRRENKQLIKELEYSIYFYVHYRSYDPDLMVKIVPPSFSYFPYLNCFRMVGMLKISSIQAVTDTIRGEHMEGTKTVFFVIHLYKFSRKCYRPNSTIAAPCKHAKRKSFVNLKEMNIVYFSFYT